MEDLPTAKLETFSHSTKFIWLFFFFSFVPASATAVARGVSPVVFVLLRKRFVGISFVVDEGEVELLAVEVGARYLNLDFVAKGVAVSCWRKCMRMDIFRIFWWIK